MIAYIPDSERPVGAIGPSNIYFSQVYRFISFFLSSHPKSDAETETLDSSFQHIPAVGLLYFFKASPTGFNPRVSQMLPLLTPHATILMSRN